MITVRFTYMTGLKRSIFRNARLQGSWDAQGHATDIWTESPMQAIVGDDGCPAFTATVQFDDAEVGKLFRWGVLLDSPAGANVWGITTETLDANQQQRHRTFELKPGGVNQEERFYFTYSRRLGAQKLYADPADAPALRFAVWAPHAQAVDVVFAQADRGYIANNGNGIDPSKPVIPLQRTAQGMFESAPVADFASFCLQPYMFRIKNAQGTIVYRTDLHSRRQFGRGAIDPQRSQWDGSPSTLDGGVSCSVVVDQDVVHKLFDPADQQSAELIDDDAFWVSEFTPGKPVRTSIQDLVIYELHIGSLGFGQDRPGTLVDGMALLDYLTDLGVNAVELLPMAEFSGNLSWGYGDTHHFVIESSAGGRDKYKHFVRECHRRGMAVIQDVVYNHFDGNAERAEWQYDSTLPEENSYYWYEGQSANYNFPEGGYLNNGSSGYTPRLWEEPVRQLFISSAAELIEEFHVDGLRVDLIQALHRDNSLNANGAGVPQANLFGQKFLREWNRTLRLIRPTAMLIAEDHSGWDAITKSPDIGGLGFDATWFAAFYHGVIGDSEMAGDSARLLHEAGFGDDRPLAITNFAGALWSSQFNKLVYHESHDEAGNAGGTMRTSKVAVNNAVLWGATRAAAEARCRVAFSLSVLSAGTPMFFMGEEIVAQKLYKFDNIMQAKEDLLGERGGDGAKMFRFYQDMLRLSLTHPALRSHAIDIIHAQNDTRVIAFMRRQGANMFLVIASLNNHAFLDGYAVQTAPDRLPSGLWQEVLNSDAALYGGSDIGNFGASIPCDGGRIQMRVPANGVLVLQRR